MKEETSSRKKANDETVLNGRSNNFKEWANFIQSNDKIENKLWNIYLQKLIMLGIYMKFFFFFFAFTSGWDQNSKEN